MSEDGKGGAHLDKNIKMGKSTFFPPPTLGTHLEGPSPAFKVLKR